MKLQGRTYIAVGMLSWLAAAFSANAAIVGTTTVVTTLRVEGSFGFIGFAQLIPTCGDRVWVDMTTSLGRSIYSTAMLAFAIGKTTVIRTDDAGIKVYGACPLYDIFVTQ